MELGGAGREEGGLALGGDVDAKVCVDRRCGAGVCVGLPVVRFAVHADDGLGVRDVLPDGMGHSIDACLREGGERRLSGDRWGLGRIYGLRLEEAEGFGEVG